MRLFKKNLIFAVAFFSIILISCVTMSDYNFSNIDKSILCNDYDTVYNELCNPKGMLYSTNDKVLENLDKGLISHYASEYQRSNKELSDAEKLIRQYYSKSITQSAASMLVNDTVIDYSGDPYEDIYTNIFMALNYIQIGKFDDAFVEIRRFDNKLKEIRQKYQVQLEEQKKSLNESSKSVPAVNVKFHNSALARYLSLLIYRTEGDIDSANVDYKMIKEAFSLQPSLYSFPIPTSIKNEFDVIPEKSARVNFVAFSGRSPIKVEENIPLFAYDGYYKISLPVMEKRKSSICGAKILAVNKENGKSYSIDSEKIESIEDIAIDTYSQKYAAIVGKTIARMVSKLVTTTALDVTAQQVDDSTLSLLFTLMGAASKVNMFVSERADVRVCRYFPATAYVAGLTVPEGVYDISVAYFGNSRNPIETVNYYDVAINGKELNLIESYCFK